MKIAALAALVFCFFACDAGPAVRKHVHIERVFMSSPNTYYAYVRGSDGAIDTVSLASGYSRPRIIDDVPAGQPIWAVEHLTTSGCVHGVPESVEIHVHSLKDIDGGAWNHGKGGHGQVELVE